MQHVTVWMFFDHYNATSVKDGTRQHRAGGKYRPIRKVITDRNVPLPVQWNSFIILTENKANLQEFLAEQLVCHTDHLPDGAELIIAGGLAHSEGVFSSTNRDVWHLQSTQEEADSRIILHAAEAATAGYRHAIIASQDTDVLVMLIHFTQELPDQVWMHVGTSKKRNPVHEIRHTLSTEVKQSLPAFHAFTGCDTTSQFSGPFCGLDINSRHLYKQRSLMV